MDQPLLLAPSVQELVPAGHLAHFVRDTVRESLDLSSILGEYSEARGYPPYYPVMMVALLLYAYCQGVYSSRRIARACEERVDFMAVTAHQCPDCRTISDFRKRHLQALGSLFGQVLRLCHGAGLVKLGHVALDGTKLQANASKHKAMSYGRMKQREAELAAEVAQWFAQAETLDAEEDEALGRVGSDLAFGGHGSHLARRESCGDIEHMYDSHTTTRRASPLGREPYSLLPSFRRGQRGVEGGGSLREAQGGFACLPG